MDLVSTISDLNKVLNPIRSQGKTIGFVPTMGALHQGHLSLVKQSLQENDISVISIFVNPTQFNNQEDLIKYPRDLDKDVKLLKTVSNNLVVFAPTVNDIYPEPDTRQFDFGQIDKVMEGEHRPGHFNGVAQVVSRLFDAVKPSRAYFGEKDFQQLAVIRAMVKQLGLNVQIVPMPIIREKSGLAMSSRNERLTESQKQIAVNISKVLIESRNWISTMSVDAVKKKIVDVLNLYPELNVEYYQVVDGYTLQSIRTWNDAEYIVGCIAVFCGDVRLIDNIVYRIKE